MDLKFEEINNWFVSEFEVTQDFNIHIEKEAGSILFYQRTAGSEYDIIHDLGPHKGNERIIDVDFTALVYPKTIKIKSAVLPTVAELTLGTFVGGGGSAGGDTGGDSDSGELKRNDVNFFDYDGTLLYSYPWDKAKELTELPALPVHDGLEVREWNYTLEDIREQGTETTIGKADVGACVYDGAGKQVTTNDVMIFKRGETEINIGGDTSMGYYLNVLSIPATVTKIPSESMKGGYVKNLVIPKGTELVDYYASFNSVTIDNVWLNGWDTLFTFQQAYFPMVFNIPYGVGTVDWLGRTRSNIIYYPSSVHTIYAIENSECLHVFKEHKFIPELQDIPSIWGFKIVVPDELYDEWCNATNWSDERFDIYKLSEFDFLNN